MLTPSYLHAQSSADDALKLSQEILSLPTNISARQAEHDGYQNRDIRNTLMDRLAGRNYDDIGELLATARDKKLQDIDIFEAFGELRQNGIADFQASSQYTLLTKSSSSEDWQRANLANIFLALIYAEQNYNLPALNYAEAALSKIPKDASYNLKIGDILYDTYDVLSTVFIYDRNVTKAVETSALMAQYGSEAKRRVDYVGIVYNLSVLFAQQKDFETALQLSGLLVEATKAGTPNQHALSNLGHGKNLVSTNQFRNAIPYLQTASDLLPGTLVDTSAKAKLALSYAQIGRTDAAKDLIETLRAIMANQPALSERLAPMIQEIEFQIAAKDGNYKQAYAMQKEWASAQVEKLEALADKDRRDASEHLAINEQVAQADFENLRQKTILQEQVIIKEQRFRYVLVALLGALAIIIALLIWARRKQKIVNLELAAAARRAEAGEQAKARFLAVMSHELRTPMNPIIALSQIVADRVKGAENRKLLSLIRLSAEQLMTLIENIVAVADGNGDDTIKHMETTDLKDFIVAAAGRFYSEARQKGLTFELRYDRGLPVQIDVNKSALKLVLNNLLSNAVKFTDTGLVKLRVSASPHNPSEFNISIEDTGIGMSAEEIPHMLTAFEQRDSSYTRKYGGAGIGLYVASKKAELIGARMEIDSEVNTGTTITLHVPIQCDVAAPALAA